MKINRMWAMFNDRGILYRWTVEDTRREVIKNIEDAWNMKWRHLYNNGFRIKKVAVSLLEDNHEQG